MAGSRRCMACGKAFPVLPQVNSQAYCSADPCQRERKKLWQRDKRSTDADYRDNQARAQVAWSSRNADYWRRYRQEHPDYAQRNRELQRKRNSRQRAREVAKMVEPSGPPPLPSGVYRLTLAQGDDVAKMDSWLVELAFLAAR